MHKYVFLFLQILSFNIVFSQFQPESKVRFFENGGQIIDQNNTIQKDVLFWGESSGLSFFASKNSISYQVRPEFNKIHRFDMAWLASNDDVSFIPGEKSASFHYYNRDEPVMVRSFNEVTMKNLYDNIDVIFYDRESLLEYDYVIQPGGNPEEIKWEIEGAESISINDNGSLIISYGEMQVQELQPIAFQGNRRISANYILTGNEIGFELGDYDLNKELIIDPVVRTWGTYMGGSSDDISYRVRTDNAGNIYMAGETSSVSGIATTGSHQTALAGNKEAFLSKYTPSGQLIWTTYYGGPDDDIGRSVAVHGSDVYLCGRTESDSNITTSNGHQVNFGGNSDAFLVKFNSNGVRQWATYYGGTFTDDGYDVEVDDSSNVIMVGNASSSNNIATSGAHKTSRQGQDCFLVKFTSSGTRIYGTYFGGNSSEYAFDATFDDSLNICIAGRTTSQSNFYNGIGHQDTNGGQWDAYVIKFSSVGVMRWMSYYGGSIFDYGNAVACDAQGNVYLAGEAASSNNITTAGAHQTSKGNGFDAFIVKFTRNGSRLWGTYYGGHGNDFGNGLAFDGSSYIYLTGYTGTQHTAISTPGSHQVNFGGGSGVPYDAYLIKFDLGGVRQWGTYMGGSQDEWGYDCVVDPGGYVIITGASNSTNNIADSTAQQPALGGSKDAYLNKFHDCNNGYYYSFYACDSVSFAGNTWYSTGQYFDTLINSNGCDSVITYDVEITQTPAITNTYSDSICDYGSLLLEANASGGIIEWFYNATGGSPLDTGQTYQTALLASTSTYYVGVRDSVCTSQRWPVQAIVKYSSTNSLDIHECDFYILPSGNDTIFEDSSIVDTLINSAGCDSLIQIQVDIEEIDISTTSNFDTLRAVQDSSSYQWIDCQSNTLISGATSQTFVSGMNGNFAVIVTKNMCSDTSECLEVIGVGIENYNELDVKIYPNPVKEIVFIEFDRIHAEVSIELLDMQGKVLMSEIYRNTREIDIQLNQTRGLYIIEIQTGGDVIRSKLLILE